MRFLKSVWFVLIVLILLPAATKSSPRRDDPIRPARSCWCLGRGVHPVLEEDPKRSHRRNRADRITDLLPGTYTLTFTLSGFATVKREAVGLTGSGVTTINADMRVGNVAETVNVTGETPVVDADHAASGNADPGCGPFGSDRAATTAFWR
jgi:hypothetical protein